MFDEIYESIDHADTDGLMTLAVEPLVVYGPRKADAHATRADALVALKTGFAGFDPKQKHDVHSDALAVVASPGGHSAWAVDVVEVGGEPIAVTAVLSNVGDVWQLTAASLAHTPAMKAVRAQLKHDAVVPPGMAGIAKVDPPAKPAVDKLVKGMVDQSLWGDDLATRSDAVFIGPGKDDVAHGKSELKKLFKKRVAANVREVAAGETTAEVTADGQLAWVTLPVVRFEDDVDPLPLRVFAIFEKHDATWKLIALHEGVALDGPGAGASFKKLVPPALPGAGSGSAAGSGDAATASSAGSDSDAPPPKKKKKKHHKKKPPPPPPDDDSGSNN